MKTYLKGARIVSDGAILPETGVLVEDGVILSLGGGAPSDAHVLDLGGRYLSHAWIDLHCHGGAGFEFIDGTEESIVEACRIHAKHGTGVLYPTISATDYETTHRALQALEAFRDQTELFIPGVHLEGPYLSPAMCGAQDPGVIRKPDPAEYRALSDRFSGLIARWDYAPEEDEDGAFLAFLRERGIIPATAHSAAQYCHVKKALDGGNSLVTHLYSCTSTVTRESGFRKLGIIESVFLLDAMVAEVIGDGCHLPAELMRMIYQIKGADRLCLISDAIRYAGLGDGENAWEGKIPYLIEDGVAKLADRSAFAGSIATADVLVRRTVEAGIPLWDVIKMITQTPSLVMGLSAYGKIAPGYAAHFTVFDDAFCAETLRF